MKLQLRTTTGGESAKVYSEFTEEVLQEAFGGSEGKKGHYEKAKPIHADFSHPIYKLRTVELDGKPFGNLNTKKLTSLNLNDNEIQNIDNLDPLKFTSLRVLRLKNNKIDNLSLLLPKLKELYLGRNLLKRIPILRGMPDLEILNLSHNRIETNTVGKDLSEGKCLKSIDLRDNGMSMKPSELFNHLKYMSRIPNLTHLKFMDNPFAQFFGEYQCMAVTMITSLSIIDETKLLPAVREEMESIHKKLHIQTMYFNETGYRRALFPYLRKSDQGFFFMPDTRSITCITADSLNSTRGVTYDHITLQRNDRLLMEGSLSGITENDLDGTTVPWTTKYGCVHFIFLGRMDEAYEERRMVLDEMEAVAEKRRGTIKDKKQMSAPHEMPKLSRCVELLEEATVDRQSTQQCVKMVFDIVTEISTAPVESYAEIFEHPSTFSIFGGDEEEHEYKVNTMTRRALSAIEDKLGAHTILADKFMQSVRLLVEREQQEASLLYRILAKLSIIAGPRTGNLGKAALATLADLANQSEATRDEILSLIDELVLPLVTDGPKNVVAEIIHSLHLFKSPRLALSLKNPTVLTTLCELFKTQGDDERDDIVGLLAEAASIEESAKLMCQEDIVGMVSSSLQSRAMVNSPERRPVLHNFLKMSQLLLLYNPDEVVEIFVGDDMPHSLVDTLQNIFRSGVNRMDLSLCVTAAKMMDLITVLWNVHPDTMTLMCDPNEVFGESDQFPDGYMGILLAAPLEQIADPVLLSASLRGINAMLNNPKLRVTWEKRIIVTTSDHSLGCLDHLLPYLGGKKYKPLYENAAAHMDFSSGSIPPVATCDSVIVHEVFCELIRFIEIFTSLADEDKFCDEISAELNKKGRERILFNLLSVPSDAVQDAVLSCLRLVPLDEMDSEEIDFMISMLEPDAVREKEGLLSEVLKQLEKLCQDESETFRTVHAPKATEKCFEILKVNSERDTYGFPIEEEEKTRLSNACIDYLMTMSASPSPQMRRYLRTKQYAQYLKEIFKNEEMTHSFTNDDILIERTWTGRNLEALLSCLGSRDRLDVYSRQAFRVVARVADVLEGRSDSLDSRKPTRERHIFDIGHREAQMFNLNDVHMRLRLLDEPEWEDRVMQHQAFASFNGLEIVLQFLERLEGDTVPESEYTEIAHTCEELYHKVEDLAAEAQKKEKESFDKAEPKEVVFTIDEEEECPSLQKLLTETMSQFHTDHERGSMAVPECMRPTSLIFEDEKMNPSYIVAAFLRCAWALLVVPCAEKLRRDAITWLKQPVTQPRLQKLVLKLPNLVDANVLSKFLAVMRLVLDLDPLCERKKSDTNDILIHSRLLGNCLTWTRPLYSVDQVIGMISEQQILCREIACGYHAVTRVCPRLPFDGVPTSPHIQAEVVHAMYRAVFPQDTILLFLQLLVYDLQLGMKNTSVNARFLEHQRERMGLRECAVVSMAHTMLFCPSMKYAMLELLQKCGAFWPKRVIRISFLAELLRALDHLLYTKAVEEDILRSEDPDAKVHYLARVTMPHMGKHEGILLALTNREIIILERPKHTGLNQPCGVCPSHAFCPSGPSILERHNYVDLTRIIRGAGQQMLAFGFIKGKEEVEDIHVYILHDYSGFVRNDIIKTAQTLSAPKYAAEQRVDIQADTLMKISITERVENKDDILLWSYAQRLKPKRYSYFLLALTEFLEFQVDFSAWIGPVDLDACIEGEDFGMRQSVTQVKMGNSASIMERHRRRSRLREATMFEQLISKQQRPSCKDLTTRRIEAIKRAQRNLIQHSIFAPSVEDANDTQKMDAAVAERKEKVLKLQSRHSLLHLKQIEFGGEATPQLTLNFESEVITIEFLDELALEEWRQGLALALNASGSAAWRRQWTEGDQGPEVK